MTTYVLSLMGDEEKATNATHWAKFRRAKLISVSRNQGEGRRAEAAGRDSIVIAEHGPADAQGVDSHAAGRATGTRDPEALAALLVRTLDIQDGMGVVLADFDNEEFAAAVVDRIAALGRQVTCTGQVARFAWGLSIRPRA